MTFEAYKVHTLVLMRYSLPPFDLVEIGRGFLQLPTQLWQKANHLLRVALETVLKMRGTM